MKRETIGVQFDYNSRGYFRRKTGKLCCRSENKIGLQCTRGPRHKGQHRADDCPNVRPWGPRA